jgi:hypothetical protein
MATRREKIEAELEFKAKGLAALKNRGVDLKLKSEQDELFERHFAELEKPQRPIRWPPKKARRCRHKRQRRELRPRLLTL